jgi:hypothetical protein
LGGEGTAMVPALREGGRVMAWRDKYEVHPAADVFPMMDDAELAELGENIKANDLREPVTFWRNIMLDGRNRMEAMYRLGIPVLTAHKRNIPHSADPVAYIISANIHRRHLTKQQQADLIVAAHNAAAEAEKLRQVDEVSSHRRAAEARSTR